MLSGVPTLSPPSLPSGEQSRSRLARPSALFVGVASRFDGRTRLNGPRYILLADSGHCCLDGNLYLIASFLRRREPSAAQPDQSCLIIPVPKACAGRYRGLESQTEMSKATEVRLRQSDYFVAKDFTTHFNFHAHSIATIQKSELTRNAQGSVTLKRVVVN